MDGKGGQPGHGFEEFANSGGKGFNNGGKGGDADGEGDLVEGKGSLWNSNYGVPGGKGGFSGKGKEEKKSL